jgi:hypothetical protein
LLLVQNGPDIVPAAAVRADVTNLSDLLIAQIQRLLHVLHAGSVTPVALALSLAGFGSGCHQRQK